MCIRSKVAPRVDRAVERGGGVRLDCSSEHGCELEVDQQGATLDRHDTHLSSFSLSLDRVWSRRVSLRARGPDQRDERRQQIDQDRQQRGARPLEERSPRADHRHTREGRSRASEWAGGGGLRVRDSRPRRSEQRLEANSWSCRCQLAQRGRSLDERPPSYPHSSPPVLHPSRGTHSAGWRASGRAKNERRKRRFGCKFETSANARTDEGRTGSEGGRRQRIRAIYSLIFSWFSLLSVCSFVCAACSPWSPSRLGAPDPDRRPADGGILPSACE